MAEKARALWPTSSIPTQALTLSAARLQPMFNLSECQYSHLSDGNKKLRFVISYQIAIIRMKILLFLE